MKNEEENEKRNRRINRGDGKRCNFREQKKGNRRNVRG